MDMRHPEYRELRRTRTAPDLRKLRNRMRLAERRAGMRLTPREAIQAHRTYVMTDMLFSNGEHGAFYYPGSGSVFQDAEGKIPAGDGDPVRLVTSTFPSSMGHLECRIGEPPVFREGGLT